MTSFDLLFVRFFGYTVLHIQCHGGLLTPLNIRLVIPKFDQAFGCVKFCFLLHRFQKWFGNLLWLVLFDFQWLRSKLAANSCLFYRVELCGFISNFVMVVWALICWVWVLCCRGHDFLKPVCMVSHQLSSVYPEHDHYSDSIHGLGDEFNAIQTHQGRQSRMKSQESSKSPICQGCHSTGWWIITFNLPIRFKSFPLTSSEDPSSISSVGSRHSIRHNKLLEVWRRHRFHQQGIHNVKLP